METNTPAGSSSHRFTLLVLGGGLVFAGLYMAGSAVSNWRDAARVQGWIEVPGEVDAAGTDLRRKSSGRRSELVSTLTVEYRYRHGGTERRGSGTFDHPFAEPVPKQIAVFVNPANAAESMPHGVREEMLRRGGIGWTLVLGIFALFFLLLGSLTLFLFSRDKE